LQISFWYLAHKTSLIMNTNKNDIILQIIVRYLEGTANSEDIEKLGRWINDSEENKRYFEQVRNIWEASNNHYDPKLFKTEKALENVLHRISEKSPVKNLWMYWKKIAAIILIPLLISNILFFSIRLSKVSSSSEPIYNEVFATVGTRTAVKLVDGTLVWLNSGSSLKYPDKFSGKQRVVYQEGEAYYEVKSNESMPFIVKTPSLCVKATGTKFNIWDYSTENKSEVTLVSGKVIVNEPDLNGKSNLISALTPNQHLIYDRQTKAVTLENEDPDKYTAWKDGKLIFRDDPLNNVVKKIGRAFNVDIEFKESAVQNYRYHATFKDESFSEILKLLKVSAPIDYIEVKRVPLPDGTFPKKKVIIFPRKTIKLNHH
jgi:transmembrane sensor